MSKRQIITERIQAIFKQNSQIKLVDLIFQYFRQEITKNTIREILKQLQQQNKPEQKADTNKKNQFENQNDQALAKQLFIQDIIDLLQNFEEYYEQDPQKQSNSKAIQKQEQQTILNTDLLQGQQKIQLQYSQTNKLQNQQTYENVFHPYVQKQQTKNKSLYNKIQRPSNKIQKSQRIQQLKQQNKNLLKKQQINLNLKNQYKKNINVEKNNKLQVSKNQSKLNTLQTSRISVKQRLAKPIRQPKKISLNKSFQTVKQPSILYKQYSKQFLVQRNKLKKFLIAAYDAYILQSSNALDEKDSIPNQQRRMDLTMYLKFFKDFSIKNLFPITQVNRLFKIVAVNRMWLNLQTFLLMNFKIIQIKSFQISAEKTVDIARQQEMIQRAKKFILLFSQQKLKQHLKISNKEQLSKIIEQYNKIQSTNSKILGSKIQIVDDFVNRNYHKELKKWYGKKSIDMQSISKLKNKVLTSKSKSKRKQSSIAQNIKHLKTQSQKTISELKGMMSSQDTSCGCQIFQIPKKREQSLNGLNDGKVLPQTDDNDSKHKKILMKKRALNSYRSKKQTPLITNNMSKNAHFSKNESSLPKIHLANNPIGRSKSQANINKAKKSLNANNQSLPSVSKSPLKDQNKLKNNRSQILSLKSKEISLKRSSPQKQVFNKDNSKQTVQKLSKEVSRIPILSIHSKNLQNRNPSRNDSKQNLLLKLKLQQNRSRNLSIPIEDSKNNSSKNKVQYNSVKKVDKSITKSPQLNKNSDHPTKSEQKQIYQLFKSIKTTIQKEGKIVISGQKLKSAGYLQK